MEVTVFPISIAIGILCGIVSGFGIGGGSLLMVWLTAVVSMNQRTAQGINLLYFIPTSAAALYTHIKSKMIDWKVVVPSTLFGCLTAILGSLIANILPIALLNKLFGLFLCIVGIKELVYKSNKNILK